MKKAEKKEVRAELYPLSKKEFEDLYNKAWENGWVYGKFFQELYDEYLVNWVYFVDYLDVLKGVNRVERRYKRIQDNFVIVSAKNQNPIIIEAKDFYLELIPEKDTEENLKEGVNKKEIISFVEILIGEAPPYWKGNAKNKDKSYFYNPAQTNSSKWLNAPADWKSSGGKFITKTTDLTSIKIEKLNFLAQQGLILFDIFPFPIIQDTKIRQAVSGKFPEHINEYFIPKRESIIKYIGLDKNYIKYGFVATTYGSLHLLFGDQTRELFLKDFVDNFYNQGIEKVDIMKIKLIHNGEKNNQQIVAFNENNIPTVLFKTIYKLICPAEIYSDDRLKRIAEEAKFEKDEYVNKIRQILIDNMIPILMDGSGNVNFTKFFNSSKNPSHLEEEENFEKNPQEED